jgi:hypothetical protein
VGAADNQKFSKIKQGFRQSLYPRLLLYPKLSGLHGKVERPQQGPIDDGALLLSDALPNYL